MVRMVCLATILCSATAACLAGNKPASGLSNEVSAPTLPDKKIAPDKLREDIEFLVKSIEEVHPNMYVHLDKTEFAKKCQSLYKRIDRPMSKAEFFKAIAPVIHSLRCDHTNVQPPLDEFYAYAKKGGSLFPLAFDWDGQNIVLADNYGKQRLPLGATILQIGGEDARKVLERWAQYFSSQKETPDLWIVNNPLAAILCVWLEHGQRESLPIMIRTTGGKVEHHKVGFLNRDKINANSKTRKESIRVLFSHRFLPEFDACLVRCDFFVPEIVKSIEKVFKEIKDRKISNLIIDIRRNPGCEDPPANALLGYLTDKAYRGYVKEKAKISAQARSSRPEQKVFQSGQIGSIVEVEVPFIQPAPNPYRFTGRTFVLVGRLTGSSAVTFTGIVKHFGIGTLIGDETSGKMVAHGNAISMNLPNTGLEARVASKYLAHVGAREDELVGVVPDHRVKQTAQDTAKRIDTVLEFTLNLIKSTDKN